MRKPAFCIYENKDADQLRGNREADQRLCFRYTNSTILFFLNQKFQASNHLLWLYGPVWVGPGRNPEDRFSHKGAHILGASSLASSTCSTKGNDRSPESQQVKSSKYFNSSQVREPRKSGDTIFPTYRLWRYF